VNDPKGSLWRKWDLHVHTPESIVHNYGGAHPWEKFIQELENLPPEFKVIGINDYLFLDGYKRILAEQEKGRLKNIEMFLPVIELRIDKFGGSMGHLSKVNYHIIFSNELTPDVIEQQFLYALPSKYILSPEYNHFCTSGKWAALPTKKSLEDLGNMIIESVPLEERAKFGSPLKEGFNNLSLSLKEIESALNSHYFKDKVVTAVGKTEWADIKWNDCSIADKKTIINGADLVFISSESIDDWKRAKDTLVKESVNSRLLDCSDAHYFSNSPNKDRIGKCFTWIKADPTFEGLRQVLREPEERVCVFDKPPKLIHIEKNKTKYIQTIRIKRKPTATLGEIWFDNISIPLNPGLIAVIGNKGKGKSALTDTIGLLCNTRQHKGFTFLSDDNFRNENKANHFSATLTWESGEEITKGLEEEVDLQQPEFVRYIPQNFLEEICGELKEDIEESEFYRELKKVIFNHVDSADRLDMPTFDDLINYKTSEAKESIDILKAELHEKNEKIVALEAKSEAKYRSKIENLLFQKRQELDAHDQTKPNEVQKPETDPVSQGEMAKINEAVDGAKAKLANLDAQIIKTKEAQAHQIRLISIADKLIEKFSNFMHHVETFVSESKDDLESIGLPPVTFSISIDKTILKEKRDSFSDEKIATDEKLDRAKPESIAFKKQELEKVIKQSEAMLDEPSKKYQIYVDALKEWETRRIEIIGNENSSETIKYYEKQLQNLDDVPSELTQAYAERLTKAKEIHRVIQKLANTFRELYAPVTEFIEKDILATDKFQLNFRVDIVNIGFEKSFFAMISQGVIGTFYGKLEGRKRLKDILSRHDFNTEAGIEAFLNELNDTLTHDQRPGGLAVRISDQLREGKNALELYDLIYALDYLEPLYKLRMGDKELHQLSPGERGSLLLVFYLLIDRDNIPLIIDQPEENLDNQTVFELLAPCINKAKNLRQIIIVTHNPNLAVVCDAEQIIHANLDKKGNYRMHYDSGSIENPTINKAIVDILEGTMPAFQNRDSKYLPQ